MSAIGGFFELELSSGKEYHQDAIRLNTGRNAFEYVLLAKNYKKVYLPYYTCSVIMEPINKLGLEYEFYRIDDKLKALYDFASIDSKGVFVYNNYFGLCDANVNEVASKCKNLIVDNSQAFFSKPLIAVDTFYSARKFFGVPDGAYLYTDKLLENNLEIDYSSDRFSHLIGRIESGAEKTYQKFRENDEKLSWQPIKQMSQITQLLLKNINYSKVAETRKKNFQLLHDKLVTKNRLKINIDCFSTPMIYPFLSSNPYLRERLIQNRVFIGQYWPNVLKWCNKDMIEYKIAKDLLALPIDQRYSHKEMKIILKIILDYG